MNHSHHATFLSRILAHLAIICLVFNPIALSAQTLPITPDGATAVSVTHTSSGIDQINIAAPNSSGLSHNTFIDYNVNAAGQVINNFSGKDPSEVVEGTGGVGVALTSTNIAGLVATNSNLSSSGSARIILNEVTSSNDSQLFGYTEIAGTKAELIIANPNGITCSGCGFINTSQLSMIAGKSEFDQNGNLGFNLKSLPPSTDLKIPLITISGLGLDAESTSATDIIASSIKLISTIYGSETTDITLKTGNGKYDYSTKNLPLTTYDLPPATQPLFALDATNLGAIQSGRIFIVATQDGFGVNLGKNFLATKSLNIDSAGNLYYENLTSPKINIKSTANITQNGNIITSGNLDIETTKTFTNFGILKSDANINLSANSLENSFLINAKNLTINAENFLNKNGGIIGSFAIQNEDGTTSQFNTEKGEFVGRNFSNFGNLRAGDLAFSIYHLANSGGIFSEKSLTFAANEIDNFGNIFAAGNLTFNISHLANFGSIQSTDDLRLTTIDLKNSGAILASQNLDFTTSSLDNDGEIYSQTNLNILAAGDVRNSNKILSNETLNLSANKLTNSNDAVIASLEGLLFLYSKNDFENNGELYANKNLTILSQGNLGNSGNIFSAGNLTFNISHLTNSGAIQSTDDLRLSTVDLKNLGKIVANNDITITADALENKADSTIASINKSLTLNLTDQLTNAGTIFAKQNFSLKNSYSDSELNNVNNSGNIFFDQLLGGLKVKNFTNSGSINSAQNLTITSSGSLNNFGNILGAKNLTFSISHLTNSGVIQSVDDLRLTTDDLENSGSIKSFGSATIASNIVTNQANALIFSAGNLTFNISHLTNSGSIQSTDDLRLTVVDLENFGEIFTQNNLTLNAGSNVTNSGKILANTSLNIAANNFNNSINSLTTSLAGSLTLTLKNDLKNSGEISAAKNLTLSGKNFFNFGDVLAEENLTFSISHLTNSGSIQSTDDLRLMVVDLENSGSIKSFKTSFINSDNITNQANALIFSAGNLTFSISHLTNSGTIQSTNDLRLTTNDLENSGSIKSFGSATIASNIITNQANALIFSAKNLTFSISHLTNSGIIQSTDDLRLTTDDLENSGSIFSNSKLDLTSGLTTNKHEIFSVGDLKLTLTKDLNNAGSINSLANLDIISSSTITNSNQILSSGNLTLSAGNLINSNKIQSQRNLAVTSQNFTNFAETLAGGNSTFNISHLTNSGTIQSTDDLRLTTVDLKNSSLISSGKDLSIKATSIVNKNTRAANNSTSSGLVAINGAITIQTDFLNNDSGMIAAKSTTLIPFISGKNVILTNVGGKFLSTNSISLNLGNADYTITGELSAKDIDITANNITNLGNVTTNDFIKLTATGSSASGNGNITNGAANQNNSNVKLSAGSFLTLAANRFISNYGTISANIDLTLTSNYSEINNYGLITGGNGITTLNAINPNDGSFNNYAAARLTANNNLVISVKNLNNFGEISVRNDLTANISYNLYNNPTALIWSGRDATFNVANFFVNTQAEIYAERNLTIQRNNNGEKTSLVQNISGNIETYNGNILVNATNFENNRSSMKIQGADFVYGSKIVGGGTKHCKKFRGCVQDPYIYANLWGADVYGAASAQSSITSGKLLTISVGNTFSNDTSAISSSGNMTINANVLNNISRSFRSYRQDQYDNTETFFATIKAGGSLTGTISSQINNGNIAQYSAIDAITSKSQSTTFNQIDHFTIVQTGIINLDLSRIISAINSSSNQKSIQSQAIEFKAPSQFIDQAQFLQFQNSEPAISSDAIQQTPASLISTIQLPETGLSNNQQAAIVNNKINLGSLAINSAATLAANPNIPLIEARSAFTNIESYYGSDYLFIKLGLTKEQFLAQLFAASEKLRLEEEAKKAEEEKVIRLAKEAEEQKLSEEEKKRRAFEAEQSRIANQANQTLRSTLQQQTHFLGDSFTESKLLKEQLASLRKDAMGLDGDGVGGEQEIKSLLDNTISEFSRLNLKLDEVAVKGLTKSQIDSLEKNIITFEVTNLNGMNIIVPKIYLSLKTRSALGENSLASNSTIFAKENLTIDSPTNSLGASLLNTGSIISGKDMVMNLASLKNKTEGSATAEIRAGLTRSPLLRSKDDGVDDGASGVVKNDVVGGNLTITAFGTEGIKNLGANLIAKNNLKLTTLSGNILNSSLVQTNDANLLTSSPDSYQLRFGDTARTSGNINSELLSTAEIKAGSIEINSANNFTNLAAKISSSEDLKISAANNINIETLQLHNRTEEHWGNKKNGGDRITDSTTNLQSEISSQGNIQLTSGSDITLQAAKLTAGNPSSLSELRRTSININSENNLFLTTAQNTDFKMESIRKNKTFTFKNNDNGNINSSVLNNEIVANGTVNLEAQNLAYVEFKSGTDPLTPSGYSATSSQLQNLKAETILKNPIDEIHKSWNQTNRGLNQTGMITVAVVATAVTGGAAIAYAPAAMGTWATVGYGAATAGASAATSTIYTSGINASMNSEGNALKQIEDISKITFKETTSKESIQQIAIAATTAALVAGAGQAAGLSNASNTAPSTLERITTNFGTGLEKAGIYSTSNILATSAIKQQSINDTIQEQGGGEKILLNTALNALAETGAKEIGTAYHNNQISKPLQLTLHGSLGCAVGSQSGNCAAGAAGAIAGEIAGEKYFKSKLDENGIQTGKDANGRDTIFLNASTPEAYNQDLKTLTQIKLQTTELSKLVGAITAIPFATANGKDDASAIYAGSNAARNSVENNSVSVAIQPVSLGYSHVSIKHEVEPQDEKFFEADPRYQKNPETGKLYMTLGAGPSGFLKDLVGDINRSRDADVTNKIYESSNLVSPIQDIQKASQLYFFNQAYKDNLPYEFFPAKISEGYNSNSYASGLLNAVNITPPTFPKYIINPTPWQDWEYPEHSPKISYPVPLVTPGYEKPVPKEFFGVRE